MEFCEEHVLEGDRELGPILNAVSVHSDIRIGLSTTLCVLR